MKKMAYGFLVVVFVFGVAIGFLLSVKASAREGTQINKGQYGNIRYEDVEAKAYPVDQTEELEAKYSPETGTIVYTVDGGQWVDAGEVTGTMTIGMQQLPKLITMESLSTADMEQVARTVKAALILYAAYKTMQITKSGNPQNIKAYLSATRTGTGIINPLKWVIRRVN